MLEEGSSSLVLLMVTTAIQLGDGKEMRSKLWSTLTQWRRQFQNVWQDLFHEDLVAVLSVWEKTDSMGLALSGLGLQCRRGLEVRTSVFILLLLAALWALAIHTFFGDCSTRPVTNETSRRRGTKLCQCVHVCVCVCVCVSERERAAHSVTVAHTQTVQAFTSWNHMWRG